MRVHRISAGQSHDLPFELLDDADEPIPIVSAFLQHLHVRGYSPHTLSAYAYDLLHFMRFLQHHMLTYHAFSPTRAADFLHYLRTVPSKKPVQRFGVVVCVPGHESPARGLAPTTINRIIAAVSSFYEFLILSEHFALRENPIQKQADRAYQRISERHRPFMGHASRQRPIRRIIRVKTAQRLPRPLSDDHVARLLSSLRSWRDKAMILLMLHGGLRPGEVLNLHLEDIEYGRRRITIRYRTDHPHGVRTKSRVERVVDLYEPATLPAVSQYVMHERPSEAESSLVFLVGGHGQRRTQPLSYHALVKLFQRHCTRAGIRSPWTTPHALRHTHATRMWEGGMRELTLQKRLGHGSPESTRIYTRVSDSMVVAEYQRALGTEDEV